MLASVQFLLVLVQLEIPLDISLVAMRIAKANDVQVILNTAPAMPLPL
jgi:sugar/nucleoside kinase (ribokinase family)